jgi:hypothetical protein
MFVKQSRHRVERALEVAVERASDEFWVFLA